LLGLVLLAGFALRAFRLDYQSLWWDETYSVDVASKGLHAITHQARADPLPHFLLLWAWIKAAGQSEYAVRYLSLLMGMLALPLLYRLARLVASEAAALFAMAMIAISGLAVYYSQETRLHMLGLLLILATAYVLLLALYTQSRAVWAGYGALAAVALFSHYYAALALLGLNLPLAFSVQARKQSGWWLANGVAILSFVPWAIEAYLRFGSSMAGQTTGNAAPDAGRFVLDSAVFMLFGRTAGWPVSIGPSLLGLGMLMALCWLAGRRLDLAGWMLSGYALLPPIGSYLLALALPGTYDVRYALLALPAWLALLGIGGSWLLDAGARFTASSWAPPAYGLRPMACALLSLAFVIPTAWSLQRNYFDPTAARDDYRSAFELVRQQALSGDVLVYESPVQITAVDYYFRDAPIPAADIPLSAGSDAAASDLAALQQQHSGTWLMLALDRRHTVEQWLDMFATPVSNQWFGGGLRVKRYLPPPEPQAQASLPGGIAVHRSFGALELAQVSAGPAQQGSIPLHLLWSTTAQPSADLSASLQLFGPDGARVAQSDGPPLSGARPTSAWQPGFDYQDELRLPLPPSLPAGLYQLRVGVYPATDPAQASPLVPVAAVPVGVAWRRVPVGAAASGGWTVQDVLVGHDSAGRTIVRQQADVQSTPAASYTWFVHALDGQGRLTAQDDHPPLSASARWRPGELVAEDFILPAGSGSSASLELGAYDGSGRRVTFTQPGGSSADAIVLLLTS
jgi:hypothetical protein